MSVLKALQAGHSKAICDRIVAWVGKDPKRFGELVGVFLAGPYRITQRATWPMSYCVEYHPELVRPYIRKLIRAMDESGQPVAVRRNILRLLQFVDIPSALQGTVADKCFRYLGDPKESIAVRVFAMTVLSHISKTSPELGRELRLMVEDQLPGASNAFKNRAGKVLGIDVWN